MFWFSGNVYGRLFQVQFIALPWSLDYKTFANVYVLSCDADM